MVGQTCIYGRSGWQRCFGFILGFKVVDAVLHYSALIDDPQDFFYHCAAAG
jgi:phosphatidylglycerol:prolipoprotein diacylglycerol transferase